MNTKSAKPQARESRCLALLRDLENLGGVSTALPAAERRRFMRDLERWKERLNDLQLEQKLDRRNRLSMEGGSEA